MKRFLSMGKFYLLLTLLCFSYHIRSQVPMTTTGSYSQDFNTLITSGSAAWTDNSTIPNWYAQRTGSGTTIVADDGSSNTGNLYSYGMGTATDRALGSVGSGGASAGHFAWGLLLRNTSGTVITDIRIGYIGEQWRNSAAAAQTINFYYQISSSIITSLTPNVNTGWTPVAGLHVTTPITGGTAGALDGNNATNQSGFANVIIPSLVLNNGEYIMIKWDDPDHSGSDHGMAIDDFIINWIISSNTITTGTVSTPPFVLTDCSDIETGTVDFTSTGTFAATNDYTAQLSDDIGSFAAPVTIGTLTDNSSNAGTINITIPAGTPSGGGYRIRVISNDPSVTGTSSAAFTITQLGVGGCASSHSDYYRSAQIGTWANTSTWESSPDNTNWIAATLVPTYLANTIYIRNAFNVVVNASVIVDQIVIENGATLSHQLGTFTVADGSGDDIDIQNGAMFTLNSTANPPQFGSGSPTINVATGGILRVAETGLTSASNGVNLSNYVYQHQSILEYTPIGPFSTSGITYFPNVNATTIPIFRTLNSAAITVGAGNNTIINGVFECNGSDVNWQLGGDKTFRNGIRGTGNVVALASSGKFIINGETAELGGTGSLIVPTTGLEIGSAASNTIVTVTSHKTITGSINLLSTNATYVELGSNNLTVSANVNGGATNAYIRTNGAGYLILGTVFSRTFPIGNTSYNPLEALNVGGFDFAARVENGINPATALPVYATHGVQRTWNVYASGNTTAQLTFQYNSADYGANVNSSDLMEILRHTGSAWSIIQQNISQTGADPYQVTSAPTPHGIATTATPFIIAKNGGWILPVDCIISTRAQKRNNTGIISWTVNSCAYVINFEVQRSVGNGAYQTIGTINPSANQLDFNFTDPSLAKGTNLYRIKVNRLSGSIKYSNIVALIYDSDALLVTSVVPNPVHRIATLTLSADRQGGADFRVYNISGSLVKQWHSNFTEGNNIIEMNVAELPAGVYQVLVSAIYSKTVTRFIKQ